MKMNSIDLRKILGAANRRLRRPMLAFWFAYSIPGIAMAQITLKSSGSLESVLFTLRKQSGYDLFYEAKDLKGMGEVKIDLKDGSIRDALEQVLKDLPLDYHISNKGISIVRRQAQDASKKQTTIKGKVVDQDGNPIAGASVRSKENGKSLTNSNKDGLFELPYEMDRRIAIISYVGYKPHELLIDARKENITVALSRTQEKVEEVVVTGTGINRTKDSFTGVTTKFSGEELKSVGNNNIIQSLRTLDPSFMLIENNLSGSDPNALPVIEVRGKSSIPSATLRDEFGADPNQPLFVLDGFPTTVQTILDLDMNRVASVTILKDAASTALYGSQASNGVVVIETVKPKSGELRFTYTQDLRVESPDLSAYNMMNAKEKLEFELLSGRYKGNESTPDQVIAVEEMYNMNLAKVQRGVDTYWLNEPVQMGLSSNNSINASGGDNTFVYNLGLNYRLGKGAMKGSGRDSYSGSINLTYRKNKFNINNITYIRGNKATQSPYGSFSKFVEANPYFEKNYDSPFLGNANESGGPISNPLYDAIQQQYNNSNNVEIQNNLNANFDLRNDLRLNAGLQLTKGSTIFKEYKSPEMSEFINSPTLQRGRYQDRRSNNFSYQGNLMLTYYKTFAQKHIVNANWRNTISESSNDSYQTVAVGFPEGNLGNPRFAYSYQLNGAPIASNSIYRSLNTTLSTNYSYDGKYLFDVVYRLDGSTAYGSNQQFSPYYSFGLGWNLHKESFVKKYNWVNSLRLTGNMGITGNQNFANVSSISVYNYNSNTHYNQFGQGLSLGMLGNPDLEPQKTRQISTAIDFSLFKDRFSGYINVYNKKTDPLIVPVDLPSSTGVFSYPYNVGSLNYSGVEAKFTYFPIYNLAKQLTWNISVTAASYKSKYDGFGNILSTLNKQQENNQTLVRYQDGNSAEAIWAIPSLGIDPVTGREMFVKKDGTYTFDYDATNIVNVGNTVADMEGVLSTNVRYMGFTMGLSFRYRLGGDVFNNTLFNKVENISSSNIAKNQDKRALYERWKVPGDISSYKAISLTTSTPMSSRFVQTNHTLSGESLNIGYLFDRQQWLSGMGLRTFAINLFTNDFLYFSTVRRERGIDYPFARTFSVSMKATF